jgi:hypothetical protein
MFVVYRPLADPFTSVKAVQRCSQLMVLLRAENAPTICFSIQREYSAHPTVLEQHYSDSDEDVLPFYSLFPAFPRTRPLCSCVFSLPVKVLRYGMYSYSTSTCTSTSASPLTHMYLYCTSTVLSSNSRLAPSFRGERHAQSHDRRRTLQTAGAGSSHPIT